MPASPPSGQGLFLPLHRDDALARSYVRAKDYTMALSVLDGALRFRADAGRRQAWPRQSMRLTMAQTRTKKELCQGLTLFF